MRRVYLFLIRTLMVLSLVFTIGCKDNDPDDGTGTTPGVNKPPTCSISTPTNNAQYNIGESISVIVEAEDTDGVITEVQLYVDDAAHSIKKYPPYNFTINPGELIPGTHILKAEAKDNQGTKSEATVSIVINQPGAESPDFVSFSDGKIPSMWLTTTWKIDNTIGYDDKYSLKATKDGVTVVTAKTFGVHSYVEFYTTTKNFNFYIDGVKSIPINSSDEENWQQWIYAISPGVHVFKWESASASKLNLDAITFAPSVLPEVQTVKPNLPKNSLEATVDYKIASNGNNTITAHGICWGTSPNLTIAGNKTTNSGNTFKSTIGNMVPNTTYYVRAYASNGVGTAYGEELSFKTAELEISTKSVTQHGGHYATVIYELSNNGNSSSSTHGICWGTNPNPTIAGNKTTNSGSVLSYTNTIENIMHNTTYYIRSYVTDLVSANTIYGAELKLVTKTLVGDRYQGGIIAYVDGTGNHGLIAAPNDQSIGIQWYNGSWATIDTGTAIGTGKSNTAAIIKVQGSGNYAAKLCDDLTLGGYDDWFLPSKDELNEVYKNMDLIGGFNTSSYYWSSSEYKNETAWYQNFSTGFQYNFSKANTYRVRAVRAF